MRRPQMTRSATVHWQNAHQVALSSGSLTKSVSSAVNELERRGLVHRVIVKKRNRFIIDPRRSRLASVADMTTAVALIFTVIVTPFEVSFLAPTTSIDALFIVNRLVDVAFLLDMVLQFTLMFPTSGATLEGAKWEDEPWKIAKAYLTGWFTLDAFSQGVSALDWYAISQDGETGTAGLSKFKLLRVVRVLRLVKLARLLRASRILKRWETRVAINYGMLQIMKVGSFTIALAHISACIWSLQTVIISDLKGSWVENYGYCVETIDQLPERVYVPAPGGVEGWSCLLPGNMYAACIYWSIMTITSIGYGDIAATHGNALEQSLATVLMFTNSVMWGRVIATFCEVLATMNPSITDFRITMDNLNRYVKSHNLPQGDRPTPPHLVAISRSPAAAALTAYPPTPSHRPPPRCCRVAPTAPRLLPSHTAPAAYVGLPFSAPTHVTDAPARAAMAHKQAVASASFLAPRGRARFHHAASPIPETDGLCAIRARKGQHALHRLARRRHLRRADAPRRGGMG